MTVLIFTVWISASVCSKAKEKLPQEEHYRIWQEDLRRFDSGKSFSLVIMPFRVFQHMLTIEDQLNTLNRIYNVLDDGGRSIFDVFNPDLKSFSVNPVKDLLEFDGSINRGLSFKGMLLLIINMTCRCLILKFRFVWDENGSEMTDEFIAPMRYFFRFELENLVGRTKLAIRN